MITLIAVIDQENGEKKIQITFSNNSRVSKLYTTIHIPMRKQRRTHTSIQSYPITSNVSATELLTQIQSSSRSNRPLMII